MATSSKIMFNLETLSAEAIKSINTRIEQAQAKVDSHHDERAFSALVAEWRVRQEEKIRGLLSRLESGELTDIQLAKFTIDEIPDSGDKWEQRRDRERVQTLELRRSDIQAKAASLVADENGSISLTKTQLREFFDL